MSLVDLTGADHPLSELTDADLPDLVRAVLLDNVDAIAVVDAGGIIVAANPACEELYGRSLAQLIGSPFGQPVQSMARVEIEIIAPDEVRYAEMHAGPTTWRGESAYVVTHRNITDRRRADQALRDYVGMTAHEIATPLTSISGFAETLEDNWDELTDAQKRHFATIIGRQAKRVARLSHDLLSLSRVDADATNHQPEPVPVRQSLLALVEEGTFTRPVSVEVPDGLTVWCDPDHLSTILRNFLSNADKYGQEPIWVTATRLGDELEISVHNAGDAVDPLFVPDLFKRFSRADRPVEKRQEGTGLGLALCAALAELNGGGCDYRDGDPDGAVFSVTLPLTRTRVATTPRIVDLDEGPDA